MREILLGKWSHHFHTLTEYFVEDGNDEIQRRKCKSNPYKYNIEHGVSADNDCVIFSRMKDAGMDEAFVKYHLHTYISSGLKNLERILSCYYDGELVRQDSIDFGDHFEYINVFIKTSLCYKEDVIKYLKRNKKFVDKCVCRFIKENRKFAKTELTLNFYRLTNITVTADGLILYKFSLKEV